MINDSTKSTREQKSEDEGCGKILLRFLLGMLGVIVIFFVLARLSDSGYDQEVAAASDGARTIVDTIKSLIVYLGIPVIVGVCIYAWSQKDKH